MKKTRVRWGISNVRCTSLLCPTRNERQKQRWRFTIHSVVKKGRKRNHKLFTNKWLWESRGDWDDDDDDRAAIMFSTLSSSMFLPFKRVSLLRECLMMCSLDSFPKEKRAEKECLSFLFALQRKSNNLVEHWTEHQRKGAYTSCKKFHVEPPLMLLDFQQIYVQSRGVLWDELQTWNFQAGNT
jgi:hypothetical protein